MADYLEAYQRAGKKAYNRTCSVVSAHILPALGSYEIGKLSRRRIEIWHATLADSPARLRARRGAPPRFRPVDTSDEGVRRRRSTANRTLNVLKAALNHAHHHRRVTSAEAWTAVKPFREVEAPRIRFLSDVESVRLINATEGAFRALATAALLTGARYGELAALRVRDFSRETGSLHIARSKAGRPRSVALNTEGESLFETITAGLDRNDLIFRKASATPWKHADQYRPMKAACAAASINPIIGFHTLRHTYASRLAMRGVSMAVIAAQLGHADTRMTERHYAHLAPSYVADTVRASLPELIIQR
jgi:integrase